MSSLNICSQISWEINKLKVVVGGAVTPPAPAPFLQRVRYRVSFETSFDSKQPKLEPKLVSALSETKHLFRLFRFYNETESFGVSIEPKKTDEQPKQFDRKHILIFFRKFRVVSVCFETVLFVLVVSI
jgi:hypothetical protein